MKVNIPKGRLTVVTGVSGSGKTTLILESLVPALEAATGRKKLPKHIVSVEADGIEQVKLIDATPIGINVRSTVEPMPTYTTNCVKFCQNRRCQKVRLQSRRFFL